MNTFLFYVGSGKCPPGGGDSNVTIKNWKLLRKKARSAPGPYYTNNTIVAYYTNNTIVAHITLTIQVIFVISTNC